MKQGFGKKGPWKAIDYICRFMNHLWRGVFFFLFFHEPEDIFLIKTNEERVVLQLAL